MSGVATPTCSTSRPSAAAQIWTSTVSEPWPLSTAPVFSTALPSSRMRTMAPEVSTPEICGTQASPIRACGRFRSIPPCASRPNPTPPRTRSMHSESPDLLSATPIIHSSPGWTAFLSLRSIGVHAERVGDLVDLGLARDRDLRAAEAAERAPSAACWCRPDAIRSRRSLCDRGRGRTAPRSRRRPGCRRHRRRRRGRSGPRARPACRRPPRRSSSTPCRGGASGSSRNPARG